MLFVSAVGLAVGRWRLAAPEVTYILHDSGSTMLAFGAGEAGLAETASHVAPSVKLVSLGPSSRHPKLFGTGYGAPIIEDRAVEEDDAFILYTSGTIGKPKGALFDHHRAVWAAMAQIVSLGLRDGDRYLHLTPMYHSGGMTFLNATTLLGGTHCRRFRVNTVHLRLHACYSWGCATRRVGEAAE